MNPLLLGQAMNQVFGIRIIENPRLVKRYQFRFPRSKKARIRRKWAKLPFNFREKPDIETVYKTPHGFICHPIVADRLRRDVLRQQ